MLSLLLTTMLGATTLQVGPSRTYTSLEAALGAAADGDTIEIDYVAGTPYVFPGVTISTNNLTIRGVGGRPQLTAADTDGSECSALGGGHRTVTNKKGLLLIDAGVTNTIIDNLELSNAFVCGTGGNGDGNNGAGIRGQGNGLIVRNCYIHDNQNGILATPATGTGEVLVENTELAFNGIAGSGTEHNIYVNSNAVTKFTMRYSYSHHAIEGHLVKTRAKQSFIYANRLTDETPVMTRGSDVQSSALIDVPEGGLAVIIGNLLHKGTRSGNSNASIWFAQENDNNAPHELYVVNNTYVSDLAVDTTVMVHANRGDQFFIANNIALGYGSTLFRLDEVDTYTTRTATIINNLVDNSTNTLGVYNAQGGGPATDVTPVSTGNRQTDDAKLVNRAQFDWHLQLGAPAIDNAKDPGEAHGFPLTPTVQYVHPVAAETRPSVGVLDIGAYEYGGNPQPVTGDPPGLASGGDSDTSGGGDAPAPPGPGVGDNGPAPTDETDGTSASNIYNGANVSTSCAAAGAPGVAALGLLLGLVGLRWVRRR